MNRKLCFVLFCHSPNMHRNQYYAVHRLFVSLYFLSLKKILFPLTCFKGASVCNAGLFSDHKPTSTSLPPFSWAPQMEEKACNTECVSVAEWAVAVIWMLYLHVLNYLSHGRRQKDRWVGRIVIEIEGGRKISLVSKVTWEPSKCQCMWRVLIRGRHHQHPTLPLTGSLSQLQTWSKVAYSENFYSVLKLLSKKDALLKYHKAIFNDSTRAAYGSNCRQKLCLLLQQH